MPPLTTVTALTTWQFVPLVSVPLVLFAALYLAGTRTVAQWHPARPWPRARTAGFFAGLAVIAIAAQGSDGVYDDVLTLVDVFPNFQPSFSGVALESFSDCVKRK